MTDPAATEPRVPLCDLAPYHRRLRQELLDAFQRVYDSGVFITGGELAAFERELAAALGVRRAVGVSSGTDALCSALLALDVTPECEVLTTPFTFFATASAIRAARGQIRFADLEPDGFGIDPEAVRSQLSERTRAVICVHLFGEPCRVEALRERCRARGVALVEDAAQALGAEVGGRSVGSFGELGCFSFFPSKALGALGDGGAVVTNDERLGARVRRIRAHGSERKHHHEEFGGNFRLDELQAAVLRRKLLDLAARVESNRVHAAHYEAGLNELPQIVTPKPSPGASCSLYTLRVLERRDELQAHLDAAGIATRVHYPTPLHLQPALADLGYGRGDFPNAERRAGEALSIPLYPELDPGQRDRVITRIRNFFR